jgi:hypothetical protein
MSRNARTAGGVGERRTLEGELQAEALGRSRAEDQLPQTS